VVLGYRRYCERESARYLGGGARVEGMGICGRTAQIQSIRPYRLESNQWVSERVSNAKEAPISGCLSHERFTYGAPGENRTHDLRFRKPSLYPLSYRGTQEILRGSRRVVHRVWVEVRWNVFAGWPRLGVPPALRGPQHGFSESHGRVPDCTSEWIRQEPPDGSG
jgi:hypothetical protein